jgi:predicted amidohydrolase
VGFPDTGVIAEGTPDEPGWVMGEIDPAAVALVRTEGHVLNHRHWADQPGAAGLRLPSVDVVPVR